MRVPDIHAAGSFSVHIIIKLNQKLIYSQQRKYHKVDYIVNQKEFQSKSTKHLNIIMWYSSTLNDTMHPSSDIITLALLANN